LSLGATSLNSPLLHSGNPLASERDRLNEQVHLLGDLLGKTIV